MKLKCNFSAAGAVDAVLDSLAGMVDISIRTASSPQSLHLFVSQS